MTNRDLQARVQELLARTASDEEGRSFTHFDAGESARASDLAGELSMTAAERGVAGAVDRAFEVAERESLGVVKHALKLFVTHDPDAAKELTIPSPEARDTRPLPAGEDGDHDKGPRVDREPGLETEPGPQPSPPTTAPEAAPEADPEGGQAAAPERWPEAAVEPAPVPARDISRTSPPEEARLDWYREDPFANDHHHHWHIVYPAGGNVRHGGGFRTQPRQGELFFYMHQQMLARYDTERVIAGLEPTIPFSDYSGPISEGYALEGYGPRPPGRAPGDQPRAQALSTARAQAEAAVASGVIELMGPDGAVAGTAPLDENVLGCEIESSRWFADGEEVPQRVPLRYSNFHGNGHVLIAGASDQVGFAGPMSYFETAIRDPVFYRWHRHVDDLYAEYQHQQGPNALGDHRADVAFRKDQGSALTADIALCFTRDVPGADQPGFDFKAWGEAELGVDLNRGGPTTDQLRTGFALSNIELPDVPDALQGVVIPREWLNGVVHLAHHPFIYFLRLENRRSEPQEVTVRLFLAHAELADDRRMWIELDKFRETLGPGANLVARPDARSSVIKRKGLSVPGAEEPQPASGETTVWCDCGWPYNLLLPSGESTADGTLFKLVVAVTDWTKDRLGEPTTCGSMSFCGARNEYPDRRRMGYPFDRRFETPIDQAIADEPSMAMREVRIRCGTLRPTSA